MKRAQLIGFSVALGAAALAFYVASTFVRPPPAPITVEKNVDSTEVLVAGTNIAVGQIVNEGSFRWVVVAVGSRLQRLHNQAEWWL